MSIFNSLGSNYSSATIRRIFWPTASDEGTKLQELLRQRYGSKSIQITYKCREAITLGLRRLDLPKGSFVAINGYTCYAVYEAVTAAGLKPYYLDITKDEFNFSAATLGQALKAEPNIRAVMIQNTLAMAADIAAIKKVCDAHKLPLVEDLAHSIGLAYKTGQEAGTVGVWAALSFSQDKMIDAVSGGALVSNDGQPAPAKNGVRFTTRLSARWYPLSTAIIRATLRSGVGKALLKVMKSLHALPRPMSGSGGTVHALAKWHIREARLAFDDLAVQTSHRQEIAGIYHQTLDQSIQFAYDAQAGYLRFPIKVSNPKKLINHLKKTGVYLSDIWYDAPIGPKKYQAQTDYAGQCPNAEFVASHMVNLPTHRHVSRAQATELAERINTWLKSQ